MPYCCKECYQKHGSQCTEGFYKECIEQELAVTKSKPEDRKRAQEALKRSAAARAEDAQLFSKEEEAACDRLEKMALQAIQGETELSMDSLTQDEQRLFMRDVADGSLSKFVELWEPWWERTEEQFTAQLKLEDVMKESRQQQDTQENGGAAEDSAREMDSDLSSHMSILGRMGPPAAASLLLQPTAWPPFAQLCRGDPPAELKFNLIDMLMSYCCTMRVFRGDWSTDVDEASAMMIQSSAVLHQDARHCRYSPNGFDLILSLHLCTSSAWILLSR
jgi:hypothetical protein